MSEKGIDAYRVASVLGYCLLPMVGVGAISVMVILECVSTNIQLYLIANDMFLQRNSRLHALVPLDPLVHIRSVRYICGGPQDVGSEVIGGVPRWIAVRLFCIIECV